MTEKRGRSHNWILRSTATVVSILFTITSANWQTPAFAISPEPVAAAPLSLDALSIPPELGTIRFASQADDGRRMTKEEKVGSLPPEIRDPTSDKFVVLIQDAHAVIDAQENIRKIIGHLRTEYGVDLAALEGAKGRLEAVLLRTFPDEGVKKKVLAGYEARAELTGPELAAVFQDRPGDFFGMEDWTLYERNYFAYQAAQDKKPELLRKLAAVTESFDRERAKVYDEKLNEFHDAWEGFLSERTSLLDLMMYLSSFQHLFDDPRKSRALTLPTPGFGSGYSELPQLIKSIGYEKSGKQEALAPLVRQIADGFKAKYLRQLGVKNEMNFYNRYQAFMTGKIPAGEMLRFVVDLGAQVGKRPKLTPQLRKLLGHTETLAEIKGSALYDELDRFLPQAQATLIRNKEQQALAAKYQKLFLLKQLIELELTHGQLEKLRKFETLNPKLKPSPNDSKPEDPDSSFLGFENWNLDLVSDLGFRVSDFREALRPALDFYQAATERDGAFLSRIESEMRVKGRQAAAVVAGGFHTNGLERVLKEKGIPYAVVTPKIASLEGSEHYAKVMAGDVSFKDYLRTTYFDALMRHAGRSFAEALPMAGRARTLKLWRDNLIRELAKEGRIDQAGKFLPYIDEAFRAYPDAATALGPQRTKEEVLGFVRNELEKFKAGSLERIWKTFEFQLNVFSDGLKSLISKKELTTNNVSALLARASAAKPANLAACAGMSMFPEVEPPALPGTERPVLPTSSPFDPIQPRGTPPVTPGVLASPALSGTEHPVSPKGSPGVTSGLPAAVAAAVSQVQAPTNQILNALGAGSGAAATGIATQTADMLISQGEKFQQQAPEVKSVALDPLNEALDRVAAAALPGVPLPMAKAQLADAMNQRLPGEIPASDSGNLSAMPEPDAGVEKPVGRAEARQVSPGDIPPTAVPFTTFVLTLRNHIGKTGSGLYEQIKQRIRRGERPLQYGDDLGNVSIGATNLDTFTQNHFSTPEEAVREVITNAYDSESGEPDPAQREVKVTLGEGSVKVKDSGTGMSLETVLKKFFPPFASGKRSPVLNRVREIAQDRTRGEFDRIQAITEILEASRASQDLSEIERTALRDVERLLRSGSYDESMIEQIGRVATFTGRFGIGFYSLLYFLKSPGDFIEVVTNTGSEAHRIVFRLGASGEILTWIEKLNPDAVDRGTEVSLSSENFSAESTREVMDKFLRFNGNAKIVVEDARTGRTETLNEEVFDPKEFAHIEGETGVDAYYSKGANTTGKTKVYVSVHGVTILAETVEGYGMPGTVVFNFPSTLGLPVSRNRIDVNGLFIQKAKEMIELIGADPRLLSALFPVLVVLERGAQGIERNELTRFAVEFADNRWPWDHSYLPNTEEFTAVDSDSVILVDARLHRSRQNGYGALGEEFYDGSGRPVRIGNRGVRLVRFKDSSKFVATRDVILISKDFAPENDPDRTLYNVLMALQKDDARFECQEGRPATPGAASGETVEQSSTTPSSEGGSIHHPDAKAIIDSLPPAYQYIIRVQQSSTSWGRLWELKEHLAVLIAFLRELEKKGLFNGQDDLYAGRYWYDLRVYRTDGLESLLPVVQRNKRVEQLQRYFSENGAPHLLLNLLFEFVDIVYEDDIPQASISLAIDRLWQQRDVLLESSLVKRPDVKTAAWLVAGLFFDGVSYPIFIEQFKNALQKQAAGDETISAFFEHYQPSNPDALTLLMRGDWESMRGWVSLEHRIESANQDAIMNGEVDPNLLSRANPQVLASAFSELTEAQLAEFIQKIPFVSKEAVPLAYLGGAVLYRSVIPFSLWVDSKTEGLELLKKYINMPYVGQEAQLIDAIAESTLDIAEKGRLIRGIIEAVAKRSEEPYGWEREWGSSGYSVFKSYRSYRLIPYDFSRAPDSLHLVEDFELFDEFLYATQFANGEDLLKRKYERQHGAAPASSALGLRYLYQEEINRKLLNIYFQIAKLPQDELRQILQAFRAYSTSEGKEVREKILPYLNYLLANGEVRELGNNEVPINPQRSFGLVALYDAFLELDDAGQAAEQAEPSRIDRRIARAATPLPKERQGVLQDAFTAASKQSVDDLIYVRELIQNVVDEAAEQGGPSQSVEVNTYVLDPSADLSREQGFVIDIQDHIGMSAERIYNKLLMPFSTSKHGKKKLLGKQGQGFFTLLSRAELVTIRSVRDGQVRVLRITPVRENGDVVDYRVEEEIGPAGSGETNGSRFQAVLRSASPALDAHRVQSTVQKFAGLVDPSVLRVVVDGTQINAGAERRDASEQTAIGPVEFFGVPHAPFIALGGLYLKDVDADFWEMVPEGLRPALREHGFGVRLPSGDLERIPGGSDIANRDEVYEKISSAVATGSMKLAIGMFARGELDLGLFGYDYYQQAGQVTRAIREDAAAIINGSADMGRIRSEYLLKGQTNKLFLLLMAIPLESLEAAFGKPLALADVFLLYDANPELFTADLLDKLPAQLQNALRELKSKRDQEAMKVTVAQEMGIDAHIHESFISLPETDGRAGAYWAFLELTDRIATAGLRAMLQENGEGGLGPLFGRAQELSRDPPKGAYYADPTGGSLAHAGQSTNHYAWNLFSQFEAIKHFAAYLGDPAANGDFLDAMLNSVIETLSHELVHILEETREGTHNDEFYRRQKKVLEGMIRAKDEIKQILLGVVVKYQRNHEFLPLKEFLEHVAELKEKRASGPVAVSAGTMIDTSNSDVAGRSAEKELKLRAEVRADEEEMSDYREKLYLEGRTDSGRLLRYVDKELQSLPAGERAIVEGIVRNLEIYIPDDAEVTTELFRKTSLEILKNLVAAREGAKAGEPQCRLLFILDQIAPGKGVPEDLKVRYYMTLGPLGMGQNRIVDRVKLVSYQRPEINDMFTASKVLQKDAEKVGRTRTEWETLRRIQSDESLAPVREYFQRPYDLWIDPAAQDCIIYKSFARGKTVQTLIRELAAPSRVGFGLNVLESVFSRYGELLGKVWRVSGGLFAADAHPGNIVALLRNNSLVGIEDIDLEAGLVAFPPDGENTHLMLLLPDLQTTPGLNASMRAYAWGMMATAFLAGYFCERNNIPESMRAAMLDDFRYRLSDEEVAVSPSLFTERASGFFVLPDASKGTSGAAAQEPGLKAEQPPVQRRAEARLEAGGQARTASGPRRILVLDDNPENFYKIQAKSPNAEVFFARDFQSAVALVEESFRKGDPAERFDQIISDRDLLPTVWLKLLNQTATVRTEVGEEKVELRRGGEYFVNWLAKYFDARPGEVRPEIILHSTSFESNGLDAFLANLTGAGLEQVRARVPAGVTVQPKSVTFAPAAVSRTGGAVGEAADEQLRAEARQTALPEGVGKYLLSEAQAKFEYGAGQQAQGRDYLGMIRDSVLGSRAAKALPADIQGVEIKIDRDPGQIAGTDPVLVTARFDPERRVAEVYVREAVLEFLATQDADKQEAILKELVLQGTGESKDLPASREAEAFVNEAVRLHNLAGETSGRIVERIGETGGIVSLDGMTGTGKSTFALMLQKRVGLLANCDVDVFGLDMFLLDKVSRDAINKSVLGQPLSEEEKATLTRLLEQGALPGFQIGLPWSGNEYMFRNGEIRDFLDRLRDLIDRQEWEADIPVELAGVYDQSRRATSAQKTITIPKASSPGKKRVFIVESLYSNREDFQDVYDLKVRLLISPETSLERYVSRSVKRSGFVSEVDQKKYDSFILPSFLTYDQRTRGAMDLMIDYDRYALIGSGADAVPAKPASGTVEVLPAQSPGASGVQRAELRIEQAGEKPTALSPETVAPKQGPPDAATVETARRAFAKPQAARDVILEKTNVQPPDSPEFNNRPTIYVFPTRFCPVGCSFCYFASPMGAKKTRENAFDGEGVERFIQFTEDSHPAGIVVSGGGDPFVELEKVLEIVKRAKTDKITLVTSAFWATRGDKADAIVRRVFQAAQENPNKPEVILRLSIDVEHMVRVPLKSYLYVVDAFSRNLREYTGGKFKLMVHSLLGDTAMGQLETALNERAAMGEPGLKVVEGGELDVVKSRMVLANGLVVDIRRVDVFHSNLKIDLNNISLEEVRRNYEAWIAKSLYKLKDPKGIVRSGIQVNAFGEYALDFLLNYDGLMEVWASSSPDNVSNMYGESYEEFRKKALADVITLAQLEKGIQYVKGIVDEVNPIAMDRAVAINIPDWFSRIAFQEAKTRLYASVRILQDYLAEGRISREEFEAFPEDIRRLVSLSPADLQRFYRESEHNIIHQYLERPGVKVEDLIQLYELVLLNHYEVTDCQMRDTVMRSDLLTEGQKMEFLMGAAKLAPLDKKTIPVLLQAFRQSAKLSEDPAWSDLGRQVHDEAADQLAKIAYEHKLPRLLQIILTEGQSPAVRERAVKGLTSLAALGIEAAAVVMASALEKIGNDWETLRSLAESLGYLKDAKTLGMLEGALARTATEDLNSPQGMAHTSIADAILKTAEERSNATSLEQVASTCRNTEKALGAVQALGRLSQQGYGAAVSSFSRILHRIRGVGQQNFFSISDRDWQVAARVAAVLGAQMRYEAAEHLPQLLALSAVNWDRPSAMQAHFHISNAMLQMSVSEMTEEGVVGDILSQLINSCRIPAVVELAREVRRGHEGRRSISLADIYATGRIVSVLELSPIAPADVPQQMTFDEYITESGSRLLAVEASLKIFDLMTADAESAVSLAAIQEYTELSYDSIDRAMRLLIDSALVDREDRYGIIMFSVNRAVAVDPGKIAAARVVLAAESAPDWSPLSPSEEMRVRTRIIQRITDAIINTGRNEARQTASPEGVGLFEAGGVRAETQPGVGAGSPAQTYPKTTQYGWNNDTISLVTSPELLALARLGGYPRDYWTSVMDVGVGAMPVTTSEMANALRQRDPAVRVIGTELKEGLAQAHLVISGGPALEAFRQIAARNMKSRFREMAEATGLKSTPWVPADKIFEVRLIVSDIGDPEDAGISEILVGVKDKGVTWYMTLSVAPRVDFVVHGELKTEEWKNPGIFEEFVRGYLAPGAVSEMLEQARTAPGGKLAVEYDSARPSEWKPVAEPGEGAAWFTVQTDPVQNALRDSGAEFLPTDDLRESGVKVSLATANYVAGHMDDTIKQEFFETMRTVVEPGGLLVLKDGIPVVIDGRDQDMDKIDVYQNRDNAWVYLGSVLVDGQGQLVKEPGAAAVFLANAKVDVAGIRNLFGADPARSQGRGEPSLTESEPAPEQAEALTPAVPAALRAEARVAEDFEKALSKSDISVHFDDEGKFLEQMDPDDVELLQRIFVELSDAKKFREQTLRDIRVASQGRVAIARAEENDEKNGRTIYLKLKKPIEWQGKTLTMLRLKGVRPKFDVFGRVVLYTEGRGYNPDYTRFEGAKIIREEKKRGAAVFGGMFLSKVATEAQNMREEASAEAYRVDSVLGEVAYPFDYEGKKMGALIIGMEESDWRMDYDVDFSARKTFLKVRDQLTDEVITLDDRQAELYFLKLGKAFRERHDQKRYHLFPHQGNLSLKFTRGKDFEVLLRDLDAKAEGLDSPEAHAAAAFYDVTYVMCRLIGAWRDGESVLRRNWFESLLKGYFGKDASPVELDIHSYINGMMQPAARFHFYQTWTSDFFTDKKAVDLSNSGNGDVDTLYRAFLGLHRTGARAEARTEHEAARLKALEDRAVAQVGLKVDELGGPAAFRKSFVSVANLLGARAVSDVAPVPRIPGIFYFSEMAWNSVRRRVGATRHMAPEVVDWRIFLVRSDQIQGPGFYYAPEVMARSKEADQFKDAVAWYHEMLEREFLETGAVDPAWQVPHGHANFRIITETLRMAAKISPQAYRRSYKIMAEGLRNIIGGLKIPPYNQKYSDAFIQEYQSRYEEALNAFVPPVETGIPVLSAWISAFWGVSSRFFSEPELSQKRQPVRPDTGPRAEVRGTELTVTERVWIRSRELKRKDGGAVLIAPMGSEIDLVERLDLSGGGLSFRGPLYDVISAVKDKDVWVIPGFSSNGFLMANAGARSVTVFDNDPVTIAWLKAVYKYFRYIPDGKKGSIGEIFMHKPDMILEYGSDLTRGQSIEEYLISMIREAERKDDKGELSGRDLAFEKTMEFKVRDIKTLVAGSERTDVIFCPWLLGLENGIKEPEEIQEIIEGLARRATNFVMITPLKTGYFQSGFPVNVEKILSRMGYSFTVDVIGGDQTYALVDCKIAPQPQRSPELPLDADALSKLADWLNGLVDTPIVLRSSFSYNYNASADDFFDDLLAEHELNSFFGLLNPVWEKFANDHEAELLNEEEDEGYPASAVNEFVRAVTERVPQLKDKIVGLSRLESRPGANVTSEPAQQEAADGKPPGAGPRAEVRTGIGRLVEVALSEAEGVRDEMDVEMMRAGLLEKARARFDGMSAEFQAKADILQQKLMGYKTFGELKDFINLEGPDGFSDFMTKAFGEFGDVTSVVTAIRDFANNALPGDALTGGAEAMREFADSGVRADPEAVNRLGTALDGAIAGLISELGRQRLSAVVNHPGEGSGAENVLRMLQGLVLDHLVVLHTKEQKLGRAWNFVPMTNLSYRPGDNFETQVEKAVSAVRNDPNPVAFWSDDLGAKDGGVFTVVAELGNIADPGLQDVACKAIQFIFLKYATLTPEERKNLATDPKPILEDLNRMGFGAILNRGKGNTFNFDLAVFVESFVARQSVESAA